MRNGIICATQATYERAIRVLKPLKLRFRYSPFTAQALTWYTHAGPCLTLFEAQGSSAQAAKDIRSWRSMNERALLVVLSPGAQNLDLCTAFACGANEYLQQTIADDEFMVRCQALLQRSLQIAPKSISWNNLLIELDSSQVKYDGHTVSLTHNELSVLESLAEKPGLCFRRDQLTKRNMSSNVVDQVVSRLRRKLGQAGCPNPIETVRGRGYRMIPYSELIN